MNARAPGQAQASNLDRLFDAWGIGFNPDQVVGDRQWGMRISTGGSGPVLPHVGIIGLPKESMADDSVLTAELESINVASGGHLLKREDTSLTFEPLLWSSSQSTLLPIEDYVVMSDHGELLADFSVSDERYVLAARVIGPASSAFDEAPEAPESGVDAVSGDSASGNESGLAGETAAEIGSPSGSDEPTQHRPQGQLQLIVVADVDLLSDRLWVQVSNFFGQQVVVPWANNGDFVMNAVEHLGGSQALISLRSRGQYARPFEVVNQLRATAAEEFKQQEQALTHRLEELEARIANLTPAADGQGQLMLSPEQSAEIEAFEAQRLEVRKQLRQVQHHLNQSIEALESQLRWLNMGLMPLLLMIAMVVVLFYRRSRSGL
ncbi:MAG: Gldg family protein [Cellvibrionaceae bacterium]